VIHLFHVVPNVAGASDGTPGDPGLAALADVPVAVTRTDLAQDAANVRPTLNLFILILTLLALELATWQHSALLLDCPSLFDLSEKPVCVRRQPPPAHAFCMEPGSSVCKHVLKESDSRWCAWVHVRLRIFGLSGPWLCFYDSQAGGLKIVIFDRVCYSLPPAMLFS
jgi:hypothetical protein